MAQNVTLLKGVSGVKAIHRPTGKLLFESTRPLEDVVSDEVPEADRVKVAPAFDGPVLFEFTDPETGEQKVASSSSMDAFEQVWCGSKPFGELFHALLTEEQKTLFATPPPVGSFRVWQLVHASLACGSVSAPNAVHLLEQVSWSLEGACWVHQPFVHFMTPEQARDVLQVYHEAVVVYDPITLTPVKRIRSRAFAERQAILAEDANITRRLFRLAHLAMDLFQTKNKFADKTVEAHPEFPEFARFVGQKMTPVQLAASALVSAVHQERRGEVEKAYQVLCKASVFFSAYLLGRLNASEEEVAELARRTGYPYALLHKVYSTATARVNATVERRMDTLIPYIKQSQTKFGLGASVAFVSKNEHFVSLWAFVQLYDGGAEW